MFRSGRQVKKISDSIFYEVEPDNDRERALEWRRSFNFINIPLSEVQLFSVFNGHNSNFDFDENKDEEKYPSHLIKPNFENEIGLKSKINFEEFKDSLYVLSKKDEEERQTLEHVQGETFVTIKSGEPTEESNRFPKGIYHGSCFRLNFEPGEDDLHITLTLPEGQINEIKSELDKNSNLNVSVGIELLSFTFEVDDALQEPYHSRDIFIDDYASAYISKLIISTETESKEDESESDIEIEDDLDDVVEQDSESFLIQERHSELIENISSIYRGVNSLSTAVWVLTLAVIASIFIK